MHDPRSARKYECRFLSLLFSTSTEWNIHDEWVGIYGKQSLRLGIGRDCSRILMLTLYVVSYVAEEEVLRPTTEFMPKCDF